jgi:hypothetical protein
LSLCLNLDDDAHPHISYQATSGPKYARWDGSQWVKQPVDSGSLAERGTSLSLDETGNPNVSYYDGYGFNLKYAHWDGSEWDLQTVDGLGTNDQIGQNSSLDLDADGYPHIAYTNKTDGVVKYAYWDGSQWISETVESARNFGTPLTLDTDGNPHIAYCGGSYDLMYATRVAEEWHFVYLPLVIKSASTQ